MAKINLEQLDDTQICKLIENRWSSSSEIWDTVGRVYKTNTAIYENKADWISKIPHKRRDLTVQANRIFVNMEAVINSLIANTPGINILPAREEEEAKEFASRLENYFRKKYLDLNIKETFRMGLRNMYFGRIMVIKAFWNPSINDFDFRAIDPRKVRFGKYARKEQDSEFAIEEIEDNLCAVIERFPAKKVELMKKYGIADDNDLYIKNPDVTYKEAWVQDYVIFKLGNIVLDKIKNPYWDWDGILVTDAEEKQINDSTGQNRRDLMMQIKLEQDTRTQMLAQRKAMDEQKDLAEGEMPEGMPQPVDGQTPQPQEMPQEPTPEEYKPYYFNYFDNPRKPYIFATIFNNENSPVGRTDMITLSADLQRGIDKRKMDIDENCELANGIIKIDEGVMSKADAQKLRYETKGIIFGKGVVNGVAREVGGNLPVMVFDDMKDSRSEIDNIMAASSAFRGERQGQETRAGRLALIQQSYLRLNELVQVVDFVAHDMFSWGMQLAKTRYTEYHYAKWMGKEDAQEIIEIIQDDFETGSEVTIIAGKTLPRDDEFKYEQAQNDVKNGLLSPVDYFEVAGYDNPQEKAKNRVMYNMSPITAVGMTPEDMKKIPPPLPQTTMRESINFTDLPATAKAQVLARMGLEVTEEQIISETNVSPISIAFKDLPLDGQIQVAAKAGLQLDPNVIMAEKAKQQATTDAQNAQKVTPPTP